MLHLLFKKLNKAYFNNSLPQVEIIEVRRKVKVIQGYLQFGDDKRTHPKIVIYKCWAKDEEIMIHEMIHLFQWTLKKPVRHNKFFNDNLGDINKARRTNGSTS